VRYRRVGTNGPVVSEIGLGTWRHVSTSDQPAADRLVGTALDLGITLFDTASSYDDAEEALGRALRSVPGDSYVVSTKVFYRPDGIIGGLSAEHIRSSTEGSLRRLRSSQIGLLIAHSFDPDVPLEETITAFGDLIAAGKIGHYGFSEWTAEQIARACAIASELGIPGPTANQLQYNVMWRIPEARVLSTCEKSGVGTVAFWILAQGMLTGKYRVGVAPDDNTRAGTEFGRFTMHHLMEEPLLERVELFARLARHHGMSPANLAIAWVLGRPGVSTALVGASAPAQLVENSAASGVHLTERALKLIDTIFAGCVLDAEVDR